jgi:hypothetical protein
MLAAVVLQTARAKPYGAKAGGISNGITCTVGIDEGRGIVFVAGPDEEKLAMDRAADPAQHFFSTGASPIGQ